MDLRGVSTTLDTVVFVLLVGVAVVVFAGADPVDTTGPRRVSDETADVLATSTTTVTFERSGTVQGTLLRGGQPQTVRVTRRAHGTYAELLAAAATANPELGGVPLTGTGGSLRESVVNATGRALPAGRANVQVRATWRAYPEAPLERTVIVGERPPPDADVAVATVTVPSGFPGVNESLGPDPTYEAVARSVARAVITGLFDPDRTGDAVASEGADRAVVADRYRRASAVLGVHTDDALADGDVGEANRRLMNSLTPELRLHMEGQYGSPSAAARAVSVDRVRVVVRAWSS